MESLPRGRDFVESFILWVTDGFVVLYGLWTLLCHAAVRMHKGFSFIFGWSFLVPLLAAGILVLLARARRQDAALPVPPAPPEVKILGRFPLPAGLAGAALLVLFYALSRDYLIFWASSCLFLGFFYLKIFRSTGIRVNPPPSRHSETAGFLALVLSAVVFVLFLHRPDHDDSYFLSIPVQALETPDVPLFSTPKPGGTGPHPILPTYGVHSVELAAGMLARLLGIRPITAAHMILPVIFAVVFACASARMLRLMLGRDWLYGLTALFFILVFNGDIHWSYGNFGLVRFFQGKAFLASGMVPLLAAYGLEYMSRQKKRIWPLLLLGQTAALGLNSAGLFVGPAVAGFSLLAAWRPDLTSSLRLFQGAAASLYPLSMGMFLKFGPMRQTPFYLKESLRAVPAVPEFLSQVFGSGVFFWAWLLMLLAGWSVFNDVSRRRWILGYSLAYLLLFLNPFLTVFWARHVLGVETIWRILWALPLAVWLAFFLAALCGSAASALGKPGAKGVALAATLVLFGVLVPSRWTTSRADQTEIRRPSWKVPLADYHLAEEIAALTDAGRFILAPEPISVWIPTITCRVSVVAAREFTLIYQIKLDFDPERNAERTRRLTLFRYVTGTSRDRSAEECREMLLQAVEGLSIQTVVLSRGNRWRGEIEVVLRGLGFQKIPLSSRKYIAWRLPVRGRRV